MIRDNNKWNTFLDYYFEGLGPLVDHYDSMGKKSLTGFQKTRVSASQKLILFRDVFHHRVKVLNNIEEGSLAFGMTMRKGRIVGVLLTNIRVLKKAFTERTERSLFPLLIINPKSI